MKLNSAINPSCTFCASGKSFERDVESILCSTLFTPAAQQPISEIYADMRNNVIAHTPIMLYGIHASMVNPNVAPSLQILNGSIMGGHDLPAWLNNPEVADCTIMFVGNVPRRKITYLHKNCCNYLDISTPWGIHSCPWRIDPKKGMIYNVARDLIDKCASEHSKLLSVYFTDVHKLCDVELPTDNRHEHELRLSNLNKSNQQIYKNILDEEIRLVKPCIIVAVGKPAQEALSGYKNVIPVRHPGAYPNVWGEAIITGDDKKKYYIYKIETKAKELGIC